MNACYDRGMHTFFAYFASWTTAPLSPKSSQKVVVVFFSRMIFDVYPRAMDFFHPLAVLFFSTNQFLGFRHS